MKSRAQQHHNDEELNQLSKEQLVEIVKTLQAEIARLKEILNADSKTTSKPPSSDLLKKTRMVKLAGEKTRLEVSGKQNIRFSYKPPWQGLALNPQQFAKQYWSASSKAVLCCGCAMWNK